MWQNILASVAGSVVSGMLGADSQSDAASSAANAQTASAQAAINEQRRQFDLSRSDLSPYRKAGTAALTRLTGGLGLPGSNPGTPLIRQSATGPGGRVGPSFNPALLKDPEYLSAWYAVTGGEGQGDSTLMDPDELESLIRANLPKEYLAKLEGPATESAGPSGDLVRKFTMEDFNSDPVIQKSFEFGLSEGEKAVQRMFGARGLSRSGAAVKAASRFATDYTGTKAGESQARFVTDQNNLFNKLAVVSGIGQATTNSTVSAGTTMANNVADLTVGAGNARGAAAIARGNAYSNAFSGIGNQISQQLTLDRILGGRTTPTASVPLVSGIPGQFSLDNPAYG